MFNCIISSKERFAMQVEGNRLQNKYDSRDATTCISINVQDWACAGLLSDKTLCWKKLKHFKIRVPAICYKCTETAISPTIWVGYVDIFLLSIPVDGMSKPCYKVFCHFIFNKKIPNCSQ